MNTPYPQFDCCTCIGTTPIFSHSCKPKRTNAVKMFDLLSPFYDAIIPVITRLHSRRIPHIRREVLDQLNAKREHRTLDVGIGTGISWRYLQPPPQSIVGVDPSIGMLRRCARRFQKLRIQGQLFCHSAEELHFGNDEFDRIVCIGVLMYIPAYHRVLKEMLRVLKPIGRLIVVVDSFWLSKHNAHLCQQMDQEFQITTLTRGRIAVMRIQLPE